MRNAQDNAAHTCSYSCDRPECIKAQRDELAAAAAQEEVGLIVEALKNSQPFAHIYPEAMKRHADALATAEALLSGAAPVTAAPADARSLALAVEQALGWRDGERDAELDSLLETAMGILASTPAAPGIDPIEAIQVFARAYKAEVPHADLTVHGIDAGLRAVALIDDSPKGGSEAWREGWALAYSGPSRLYGDDGELQDNSEYPYIDWRRDSAEVIRDKITERANRKLAKTQASDAEVQP